MAVVRHAAARVLSLLPRATPNFTLTKQPPQLLAPNCPTPQQSLYLSNIDDQLGLRLQAPLLLFYRGDSSTKKNDEDPVKVIREALAKVLVHYYPFAGRLRETDNGKLRVDCTGEGILFQEADANVSLKTLEISIHQFLVLVTLSTTIPHRKPSQTLHFFQFRSVIVLSLDSYKYASVTILSVDLYCK
jgi:hypothetical protein